MATGLAQARACIDVPRPAGGAKLVLIVLAILVCYAATECLAAAALGWHLAVTVRVLFFAALLLAAFARSRALVRESALARTDYLTGVANDRRFYEVAEVEARRARRYRRSLTVALLDIDDFKAVNDRRGHAAGDALLREVARTLRESLREFDLIARLGGDEFAMLLPETDARQARAAVGKLESRLRDLAGGRAWPVTFSIGAATCEGGGCAVEAVLKEADRLMYSAKRSGKNRSAFGEVGDQAAPAAA